MGASIIPDECTPGGCAPDGCAPDGCALVAELAAPHLSMWPQETALLWFRSVKRMVRKCKPTFRHANKKLLSPLFWTPSCPSCHLFSFHSSLSKFFLPSPIFSSPPLFSPPLPYLLLPSPIFSSPPLSSPPLCSSLLSERMQAHSPSPHVMFHHFMLA